MAAYTGPKNVVVLGGGLAGLAAVDALTKSLADHPGPLPDDLRITLVEAEEHVGGRAGSRPLDADAHVLYPEAPWGTNTPHGLHFVWGSYAHLLDLLRGIDILSPSVGTSTYCAWMAPPDVVGDVGRVVAVHVCDPSRPGSAWRAPARRVLEAFARRGPMVDLFERVVRAVLDIDLEVRSLLSYMDIVFADDELGPELRWILFLTGALSGSLGEPERNPTLRKLLGGKSAADADIGEMMKPLFGDLLMSKMHRVRSFRPLARLSALLDSGLTKADAVLRAFTGVPVFGALASRAADHVDDLNALADFLLLLALDAGRIVPNALAYDPRASGYLKNILKAAFSSPYGLDAGTSMRDAQFGVRRYEGAVLQLFDGDDPRAAWEAIARRIESRFAPSGPIPGEIIRGKVASRIHTTAGHVSSVDLADTPPKPPAPVPTTREDAPGATVTTLPADAIISTLLPQALEPLLPNAPETEGARARLAKLALFMNETLNLQLFFPERHDLPLTALPSGASETAPFGISNLEGPFTIVVDLRRGWSDPKFQSIRLDPADAVPFDGTAWELVGSYSDLFTFDKFAHSDRFQWPLAIQESLAALLCDPSFFDPSTLDERPWLHDSGAPGRLAPPAMGEVLPARRAEYAQRWYEQAVPQIVGTTLLQLAAMPGLASSTASYLATEAGHILRHEPTNVKFVLTRNAHARARFFSAEPGLFGVRPHARFEMDLPGLFAAGDWTRNGLNLQAMEAAVISGLQSASGVLEMMRGGGLDGLVPPRIRPEIVPRGAWDTGFPEK